jgi:hypothetical protein
MRDRGDWALPFRRLFAHWVRSYKGAVGAHPEEPIRLAAWQPRRLTSTCRCFR